MNEHIVNVNGSEDGPQALRINVMNVRSSLSLKIGYDWLHLSTQQQSFFFYFKLGYKRLPRIPTYTG